MADSKSPRAHREDPVPQRHLGYKQRRSLETFEKLLEAAEAEIVEKSFDEVSVNEICDRAGLSIGAFYRRFESKDGLLQVLHERYAERVVHLEAVALSPARWEGVPLQEMIERVIDEIIETTKGNLGLLRASNRMAQEPEFAARERRIQGEFVALMARLVLQRVEEIGHPHPRTAAEFCAYQLRSVLHYHLLAAPMLGAVDRTFTDTELSRELTASLVAYLQASPKAGDGRPKARARRPARSPDGAARVASDAPSRD
jgi:AcrR family transcriptional regulator